MYLRRYIEGDSDKLSLGDFETVLTEIGFDREEACDIFAEISGGGEEQVRLPDVAAWWKQHHESVRLRKPPEMSSSALLGGLKGLQSLLGKNGLGGLAEAIGAIAEGHRGTKLLRPTKPLPPPELCGDWIAVAEEVEWRLHIRDLRAAAHTL